MKKNIDDKTSKNNKGKVIMAVPYDDRKLSGLGDAKNMLVKQFQFPLIYEYGKDKIHSKYLDRLRQLDLKNTLYCLQKYNLPQIGLENNLRKMDDQKILDFLCKIMKVERSDFTGYRILVEVAGGGFLYYSFQLFSKHPDTDTEVFSGEHAPNVKIRILG